MSQSPISNLQSPIFLLGFMASGKSTIGRVLATRLQVPFIDLDDLIVHRAGKTIGEVIQQKGEPYFRQLETECLQQAIAEQAGVIALGGGAFTQEANRALVAQVGVSVWLDAPFALCWQRIQNDAVVRPLAPTEAEAHARYQQRIALYEQAQMRVEIQAEEAAETIVTKLLQQFSAPASMPK